MYLLNAEEYMFIQNYSVTGDFFNVKRISKFKFIYPIPKSEAKFIGNYLYDENFNKVDEGRNENNNSLILEKGKVYYNVYEFEANPDIETYIRLYVSNKPFINQYTITNELSKNGYDNGVYYSEFRNRFGSLEFYNKILPGLGKNIFLIFKFETK